MDKLYVIDIKDNAKKQQYMEQCLYGVYIALICQPKTIFDYLIIAQLK